MEQSKLTSAELLEKAMLKAGQICSSINGHREYAGTPFIQTQNGNCVYLTNGATSVCNGNKHGHHRALCYCSCNYL